MWCMKTCNVAVVRLSRAELVQGCVSFCRAAWEIMGRKRASMSGVESPDKEEKKRKSKSGKSKRKSDAGLPADGSPGTTVRELRAQQHSWAATPFNRGWFCWKSLWSNTKGKSMGSAVEYTS